MTIETMHYEDILARMQQRYRELTGFDADSASDIGIRLRVLAEQVEAVYGEMEHLYRQAFPQTSTGEALDRHAQCRGLARKPALAAEGMLRFSREVPAGADITIGAGVLCATRQEPQYQFETTEEAVLPQGETEILVPARAASTGEQSNVAAGAVCLMVSAATGLSAVDNPEPFSGGADQESDEALRARLLDAYRNISNGTNAAFYYDMAMQNEWVSSVAVLPRARGRGTVDVVIHCAAADEDEAVAALQQQMEVAKEINVDVAVSKAARRPVSVTVGVTPGDGYDFDDLRDRCREALTAYLNSLGVGKPLLRSHLTGLLLEVEGVYNLSIETPAADVYPDSAAILQPQVVAVERLAAQ